MCKKLVTRALVFLLCITTIVCGGASLAGDNVYAAGEGQVTRAEWLTALVDTFDMTVEEDGLLPDNYFSDLDPSSEYYRDFLVAVEFGLVNVEAGDPVYPEEPVTREFAATTLNYCLAFQLEEGTTYTFSDADAVADPVSAQVAVNRGWLALIDGKFSPETNITVEEKTTMLADATEVWHSTDVDESHKDTYKVKEGVIEVQDGTEIIFESDPTETENGSLQIVDCPVEIKAGDIFVVHINDIPVAYKAASVEKDGSNLVVTTEYVELTDAFDELDIQGTLDGNAEMTVEPAEGVEMSVEAVPESTPQKLARKLTGRAAVKVRNLTFHNKIDLGGGVYTKYDAELKNIKINYQVNLFGTSSVELTGNMFVSCSAGFSVDLLKDLNVTLAEVGVPGVGGVRLYAEANLAGKVTVSTQGNLTAGVQAGIGQGFRAIKKFQVTDFRCVTEVSAYAGLKAEMGVYGSSVPFKGYVYAQAGVNGLYICADYADGTPRECVTHAGWISASYGAELSCKYIGLNESWSETIYDMNNSPVRVYHHYEDRAEVPACTRPDDFAHYGKPFGYYTKGNSPFWGNGWANGMGSHGFDENGEPIEIYKYTVVTIENIDYAKITGFYGNVRDLTVPEQMDGYKVISIENNVFKGLTQINSVHIGDSIETIGNGAFYECTNLSYVHLPDNLKSMGVAAFGKTAISSIEIPKSLESCSFYGPGYGGYDSDSAGPFVNCAGLKTVTFEEGTVRVAEGLFAGCTGLEEITVPDTVESIDRNGFRGAVNLRNVIYSKNLTSIGQGAFLGCESLTEAPLPDTVTSIGNAAFMYCSGLSDVHLPKSLKTMGVGVFAKDAAITKIEIPKSLESCSYYGPGYDAFDSDSAGPFVNCDGLKTVTFEEGTTRVAQALFAGCTGLEEITIPDTVVSIDRNAFRGTVNLRKVAFSKNLTSIGQSAFYGCKVLTEAQLPDTITSIDNAAFMYCTALTDVHMPKSLKTMGVGVFGKDVALTKIEIPKSLESCSYYGPGYDAFDSDSAGPFVNCDGLKTVTFEDGTVRVAQGLFAGCTGLEEITIPDTVVSIDRNGFRGAVNLKKVTFSKNLTSIGQSAFYGCKALTEAQLPDTIKTIDNTAFMYCTALADVHMPKSLKTMGTGVFGKDVALTKIEIPKSLESCSFYGPGYGGYDSDSAGPFVNCDGLKTVTFEEGTSQIVQGLFAGCTGLEEITIPDTVVSIERNGFRGAVNLKKVTYSKNLTSIGQSAFYACSGLNDIEILDTVQSIGNSAFYGCSSLQKISIPPTITSIGENTFRNTESLKTIIWNDTLTNIEKYAFAGSGIEETELPESVTTIGNYAFSSCPNLKKFVMKDRVTSLGTYVFSQSDALTDVTFSENLTTLPASTFEGCDVIQKVVLPHRITTINGNAFKECPELREITIFRNAATINATAFPYPHLLTIYGVAGTYAETFANDNNIKFVAIDNPATSVTLNKTELNLNNGASETLLMSVSPADYTDAVSWKSNNESVVTVDEGGKVTAKGVGTASVRVTVGSVNTTCKITVIQSVTSINLNRTSLSMDGGSTFQLTATPKPDTAADKSVTWTSSDEKVATVSETGLVTALSKGTADITVTSNANPSVSKTCKVTVNNTQFIANTVDELESPHNYENNCTDSWTYTDKGASSLKVTFSDNTFIDDFGDYLYIYNADGSQQGEYTGDALAGKTVEVTGDTVVIKFKTDASDNAWGFKVTNVERVEAPCEHEWGEWTETKAATCTEAGEQTRTCAKCHETETKAIEALGHDPAKAVQENVVEATCEKAGSYDEVVYCSRCHEELSRETKAVEALGHEWGDWTETKAATCTEAGEQTRTCSRCNKTETQATKALGHEPAAAVQENVVEATCEMAGSYDEVVYCSRCHEEMSRETVIVDALGHDWGEWEVITPATEQADGLERRTCSRCDKTEEQVIPKIDHVHNLIKTDATEATCTEDGNIEYWTCTECGLYFSDDQGTVPINAEDTVIYATGHDEEVIDGRDATCTEPGLTDGMKCSVCGEVIIEQEEIPALGHDLTHVDRVEPTFEEVGCKEHWVCDRCGDLFADAEGKIPTTEEDLVIPMQSHEDQEEADKLIDESETAVDKAESEDSRASAWSESAAASAETESPDDAVINGADSVADAAVQAAKAAQEAAQKAYEAAKKAYGEDSPQALAAETMVSAARSLVASTAASKASTAKSAATSASKKAAAAKAAAAKAAATPGQAAIDAANEAKTAADEAAAKAQASKEAADTAVKAAEEVQKAVNADPDATQEDKDAAQKALNDARTAAANAEIAVTKANNEAADAETAVKDAETKKAQADAAAQKAAAAKAAAARETARQGVLDSSMPKISISKPKAAKKSFTAKWKKVNKKKLKKVQKIEVWVCMNKSFGPNDTIIKVTGKKKSSLKIKGLQAKKKYFVKVRTIRYANGVKYVSKWSKVKSIKTK